MRARTPGGAGRPSPSMTTLPLIGRQQADGQAHGRALAGAVRPEQAEHFAPPDRERQIVHGRQVAVALADVGQGQHENTGLDGAAASTVRPVAGERRVSDRAASPEDHRRIAHRHRSPRHPAADPRQRRLCDVRDGGGRRPQGPAPAARGRWRRARRGGAAARAIIPRSSSRPCRWGSRWSASWPAPTAAPRLPRRWRSTSRPPCRSWRRTPNGVALGTVVAVIAFLSLVIGELVPKNIALTRPETIASWVARPMMWLSRVGGPFVALLDRHHQSHPPHLRHQGPGRAAPDGRGDQGGHLRRARRAACWRPRKRSIVQRVLQLGDQRVSAIMTPRPDIEWIDADASAEELREFLASHNHTQFVVCQSGLDNVLGIVRSADLLPMAMRGVRDRAAHRHPGRAVRARLDAGGAAAGVVPLAHTSTWRW